MGFILNFNKGKIKKTEKSTLKRADTIYEKPLERCVVCGAMTEIPVDQPIKERKCYVPGGGQLCRNCCIELYRTDDLRSL